VVTREGDTLLLEIYDGRRPDSAFYFATPLSSDWGTAFTLEKQDAQGTAERYDVLLDDQQSSCTCKGFCYHQKPCKHILGLRALANKLVAQSRQSAVLTSRKTCSCRSSDEHQILCLDPYNDAA